MKNLIRKYLPLLSRLFYILIICFLALVQMQMSEVVLWVEVAPMTILDFFLNYSLLMVFLALFSAPWKKIATGGWIFAIFTTVIAVANMYTVMLHGSLLTIAELGNAGTAFNVLGEYNFIDPSLLKQLLPLILVFVIEVMLTLLLQRVETNYADAERKYRLRRCAGMICLAAICFCSLNTEYAQKKKQQIRSSWNQTQDAKTFGYPLTVYAQADKFQLQEPEGYNNDVLNSLDIDTYKSDDRSVIYPDIFLILNESFYDFSVISDIKTNIYPMEKFYEIDGGRYGYAVTRSRGGTNNTEFELLTSISQSLVGQTPFNVLDMRNCSSIVSLLQAQGYYTIGTHCEEGQNYNRINGYSQIGFDEVHFMQDYENARFYDKRFGYTDESVYENLIRWYEDAKNRGKPVFTYCLTMQNHGGFNQNPPESDIISLEGYSGEYNEDELTEYLSCVYLSGKAIKDFCEYLSTSDRPTVLCMIGDHSPSFSDMMYTKDLGERQKIVGASMPLLIWSNFDIPLDDGDIGSLSAIKLGPLLMKLAGLELSPFYNYILGMTEQYPVVTGWGEYMDSEGNVASYQNRNESTLPIWNYFYLSYNNLLPESKDEWFTLSK